MAYTLNLSACRNVELTPLYDRQIAGVIICYKQVNLVSGVPWPQIYIDKYPATITDYTPNVLTHVVELAGRKVTNFSGSVRVASLANAFSSTANVRAAFWLALDSTLQAPEVHSTSVTAAVPTSVVNAQTGAAVDTTTAYPNILLPGCIVASWMGVNWVEAVITMDHGFTTYSDPLTWAVPALGVHRTCSMRVILTNAITQIYTGQQLNDTGDPIPPLYPASGSLAQAMYNSTSALQYEGQVTLLGQTLRSDIAAGSALSLVGPSGNTYGPVLVQSVATRPHYGEMRVSFGPVARQDLQGLITMWMATRWRTAYNLPSGRGSATASDITSVDSSGASARHDTAHGVPQYSRFEVTGS